MRKVLFCLLLGLASFARGQDVTGTITGSGCLQIDAKGGGVVGISVTNSGTAWSGTIQPQIAIGGDPAQNTTVTPYSSSTAQSTITANGIYNVNVSGGTTFLLCGNTVTNTAGIKMNVVHLSGSLGRGSGTGGGAFVSGAAGTGFQDVNEIAAPSNPASGVERLYSDSTTHLLTCLKSTGASCFSTTVAWNATTNPAGNLALTMGTNTSIFSTTTAVAQAFAWKNTTAATVTTPQSSSLPALCGREWVGAGADGEGCMVWQFVPSVGLNAGGTFAFTHSGTGSGAYSTTFPGSIQAGASGGVGGTFLLPEGTAASGVGSDEVCYGDSTAHALKCSYNNVGFFQMPQLVASGTSAMGTGGITSGTCATVVTTAATSAATTDNLVANPTADPTGVTGYAPASGGSLYIQGFITSGNVNFKVCNPTSGTLTPAALTMQWRVLR